MRGMTDPHLVPLLIADRCETKYVTIFLASSAGEKEFSLHIKLKQERGMHEWETMMLALELEASEACTLNGIESCLWRALGRKETPQSAADISGIFERYGKHLDRVIETCWDYRSAMRNIGHPLAPFDF